MSYDHDAGLAATWATSVARLTTESRRLLDRLAMLAPDPFSVSFASRSRRFRRFVGVLMRREPPSSGLFAYSLIARASGEEGVKGFSVHRLVQDFARQAMTEERRHEALRETLEWVNAAFEDDPQDWRSGTTGGAMDAHLSARHCNILRCMPLSYA